MFRTNLVVHHQEHSVSFTNNFKAARLACTIVPNCVIQYIMWCSWWRTTKFVRNMQSRQKNCGIKMDCKNCASRWSLTHCNMMHGTHNVRPLKVWESLLQTLRHYTPSAKQGLRTFLSISCKLSVRRSLTQNVYCIEIPFTLLVLAVCSY